VNHPSEPIPRTFFVLLLLLLAAIPIAPKGDSNKNKDTVDDILNLRY